MRPGRSLFPGTERIEFLGRPICNISNALAVNALVSLGFSGIIASPELGMMIISDWRDTVHCRWEYCFRELAALHISNCFRKLKNGTGVYQSEGRKRLGHTIRIGLLGLSELETDINNQKTDLQIAV
jgi:hypothetical protein